MAQKLNGRQLQARCTTVKNMLKPLCKVTHPEVILRSRADQVNLILGNDGGSLRENRYPSRVAGFFLNYFEIWIPDPNGTEFELNRAYFHVDEALHDGLKSQEIIALHCDPRTLKADKDFLYKSGPHMHFGTLSGELGKAHVALCLDSRERVCRSLGDFSNAMGRIVQMINIEMMPRLQRTDAA
jgi:hypothetical protein